MKFLHACIFEIFILKSYPPSTHATCKKVKMSCLERQMMKSFQVPNSLSKNGDCFQFCDQAINHRLRGFNLPKSASAQLPRFPRLPVHTLHFRGRVWQHLDQTFHRGDFWHILRQCVRGQAKSRYWTFWGHVEVRALGSEVLEDFCDKES